MSFFVKAAVDALKHVPQLNAEVRDPTSSIATTYDIGIAVGGGKGLVVPVLRNAELMSFAEIELAIADFARRAADNKLQARRTARRHVHDLQRRRLRLAALDADRQPAAKRHPRPARHPRPPRGARRPGRDPPDDVRRPDLRPPHRRRPRGGHVPEADQRNDRRTDADAAGDLSKNVWPLEFRCQPIYTKTIEPKLKQRLMRRCARAARS